MKIRFGVFLLLTDSDQLLIFPEKHQKWKIFEING